MKSLNNFFSKRARSTASILLAVRFTCITFHDLRSQEVQYDGTSTVWRAQEAHRQQKLQNYDRSTTFSTQIAAGNQ